MTAWQRAGQGVRALPRSPSVAPPLRRPCAPLALLRSSAGAVTAVEGQPGNTVAVDILTPGQFLASAARARFGNLHHLHRRDFLDIGVHPGKARTAVIQDDRVVATSLSNLDRGGPGTSFGATKLALLRSLKELPL